MASKAKSPKAKAPTKAKTKAAVSFKCSVTQAVKDRSSRPIVAVVGPDDLSFPMAFTRVLSARGRSARRTALSSYFSEPAHPRLEPCSPFTTDDRELVLYDAAKVLSYSLRTDLEFATSFLQPLAGASALLLVLAAAPAPNVDRLLSTARFLGLDQVFAFADADAPAERSAAAGRAHELLRRHGFAGDAPCFAGSLAAMQKCRCKAECATCEPMLGLAQAMAAGVAPRAPGPASDFLMLVQRSAGYGVTPGEHFAYGAIVKGRPEPGAPAIALGPEGRRKVTILELKQGRSGEDGVLFRAAPAPGPITGIASATASTADLAQLAALVSGFGVLGR